MIEQIKDFADMLVTVQPPKNIDDCLINDFYSEG